MRKLAHAGRIAIAVTLGLAGLSGALLAQAAPETPGDAAAEIELEKFKNLNTRDGEGPAEVDLAAYIGKVPVVLLYWIAGHPRADTMFQELQTLTDELGADKIALVGAAVQRPGREADVIARRLKELGIRAPVIDDENFYLGSQLGVRTVPHISILDKEGVLRLTNGGSLQQVLEYKFTLVDAIRRVASTGKLATYGFLPRYYPVKELVGKPCPDFRAPLIDSSVEQRWSSMIGDQLPTVLIFWSVDCPHCRKSLPEINEWLKGNPDVVHVVSAANVSNETNKVKTQEYCTFNEFVFPTLVDQDQKISELYNVTSTPTILVIRPDGVVDSVLLHTDGDFGEKMQAASRRIAQSG